MAVQDIFNNSLYGSQFLLGDEQNNTQQTDVLGRSLSPTPNESGMPAIDPQNDDRNPHDYKRDLRQANIDTLDAHDTEGRTVGKDGFIYNTAPDDRKSQFMTGFLAYGYSMLAGESDGTALYKSGQAVDSHLAMLKRQKLIPQLEAKDYQPVDIQRYVETGDTKDLITNKGKWQPLADGVEFNNLTGETRRATGVGSLSNTLPDGYHVGINFTPNGPVSVTQNAKGQYEQKPASKSEIEATQKAGYAVGGEDGSESLNAQNAGYVGFRTGTNNKPIEAGQFDQAGNPLYFGADNKSLVDASGNVYTGATSNEISQKKDTAQQKTSESTQGQIDLIDQTIKTANDFKNSKGRSAIYGWSGMTPNLSDDARNAEALRKQLSGQTFLQARQYLKGQGAITDYESQKAETALALILDTSISDDKAKQAIDDYLGVLNKGRERLLNKQRGSGSAPAQQGVINVTRDANGRLVVGG
ncbi:hypothetical protein E2M19_19860 [Salmonella enterica subsp. enterica serovar Saintpaul]|nr:hypothetical protein [Salmonella enterica subsp. enterica serovar Saintpaul]